MQPITQEYYEQLWELKNNRDVLPTRDQGLYEKLRNALFNPNDYGRTYVAKELLKGSTGLLLDVGCWGGEAAKSMGAFDQFSEVYGVDIIESSVQRAREIGMKAVVCNLNNQPLPFPDSYFDAVTCLAVIGQVFDPDFVLSEAYRVLKPAGVLIVNVPNVASLSNRIRLLFGRAPVTSRDPGWDGAQLHYFTVSNLTKALVAQGFSVKYIFPGGAGQWLRRLRPSLLSGTFTIKAVK